MAQPVKLGDLIDIISQQDSVDTLSKSALKKKFEGFAREHEMTPLGKPARARIERQSAYAVASKEINKWNEVVQQNRNLETLDLTKQQPPSATLESIVVTEERSSLQKAIDQALGITAEPEREETVSSGRAQQRSKLFHAYLKQKRISKIKSKLYHKIKNKHKRALAPEATQEQEDLMRAEERVTLKHSRSAFKRNVNRFASRDPSFRDDALAKNEAIRQRIMNVSKVTSEGIVHESSSEDDEAYLAEQLKFEIEDEGPTTGVLGMKFMREARVKQREREKKAAHELLGELNADEGLTEGSRFKFDEDDQLPKKRKNKGKDDAKPSKKAVLTAPRSLFDSKSPDEKALIDRAFATEEMDKVAQEEWEGDEEEAKPLRRPGWGNWAGLDIKEPVAIKPLVYKTDKVLVNDDRNTKAAKYLVKKLPFPYKSTRQFEAVHNIPLGKDWNSLGVHRDLITPDVLTTAGSIIEPISLDEVSN
jgi:U3 small nucleolar RNA-associated protein 14